VVDFHESWQAGYAIESDHSAIFFIPVALTITKWRTFKLSMWVRGNTLITFVPIGRFGWNFVWR
jgi:hypothetical protein